MCKRILFLLLSFAFSALPASADPLRITSGAFVFDIEGDSFTFNGDGFALRTTEIGIYSAVFFPGRCGGTTSKFGFCHEPEGVLSDWSFRSTGGEQLLGRGDVMLDGVNATNVDFVGTVQVNVVPKPVFSGGALEGFGVVDAPFSFEAMIRGIQDGDELFARQFVGNGLFGVGYERITERPGFVMLNADTDTIFYRFSGSAAPIPEPATLLLVGSGFAATVMRRRRQKP
jgi:hypothetical protein